MWPGFNVGLTPQALSHSTATDHFPGNVDESPLKLRGGICQLVAVKAISAC